MRSHTRNGGIAVDGRTKRGQGKLGTRTIAAETEALSSIGANSIGADIGKGLDIVVTLLDNRLAAVGSRFEAFQEGGSFDTDNVGRRGCTSTSSFLVALDGTVNADRIAIGILLHRDAGSQEATGIGVSA